MFSVQSVHRLCAIKNEWFKIFEINNQKIHFKLDSGAEINTLSENDYKKLGLCNRIKRTNIILEVYGGFKMKPVGEIEVIFTLEDKSTKTQFVIIDKVYNSKSIIGLPTLLEFDLLKM